MKKLLALFLLLALCSCTAEENLTYDQEHIDVTLKPNAMYTAMTERDVIGARVTDKSVSFQAAPVLYQSEEKGYLLPNYPEDIVLAGREAASEYRQSGEALNRIEIYSTPECSGEPEKVIELTGMEHSIWYQFLYADEETGHFTCIGVEQNDRDGYFYEFSETGEMLQRIPLPVTEPWHLRLVNISRLYGDRFYCLEPLPGMFDLDALYDIYCYDFSDGTKEKIAENVAAADFEGDTVYYLRRISDNYLDAEGFLCRLDLNTLESEELAEMNVIEKHPTPLQQLVMDTEHNLVYYSTFWDVFVFNPETQENVHVIHSGGGYVVPIEIQDSRFYCEIGLAGYFVYDLPETPVPYTDGLTPLKFIAYHPSSDAQTSNYNPFTYTNTFDLLQTNGYSSYSEAHIIKDPDEYAFTMAKKLMAGDTDFDIFYVSTEMAQLFEARYYEDLNRYSRLSREYFGEMVPGLIDICSIDGRLALMPLRMSTNTMQINPIYAAEEITFPRTVDDLLQLADTVTLKGGSYLMGGNRGSTIVRKLFEEFSANYILSDLDDETALADLTYLYEACLELTSSEKIIQSRGYNLKKRLISFGINNGIDVSVSAKTMSGSLPKINESYKIPVSGEFWAINPNSPNKELAGAFMLCFLGEYRLKSYSGTGVYYVNGELPEGTPAETEIRELFRQQLTEGIRNYEAPDVFAYVDKHFREIGKGEITAAQAAEELMRYLRMVKFE